MIQLTIPKEELQKIEVERFTCTNPQISRRLHALFFKGLGYPHQDIARHVGLALNTLTSIFRKYASGGLEAVKTMDYVPKRSVLENYREQLQEYFTKYPPNSVKQACAEIEKLTGIKKGKERVRVFLHQLGLKPRKVGGIPAKADPQKQEDFKKKPGTCPAGSQGWEVPGIFC